MSTWEQHTRTVRRAAGMVSVQAACSLDEAVVLMDERAQVIGQSREAIATAVVERLIWFDRVAEPQ